MAYGIVGLSHVHVQEIDLQMNDDRRAMNHTQGQLVSTTRNENLEFSWLPSCLPNAWTEVDRGAENHSEKILLQNFHTYQMGGT